VETAIDHIKWYQHNHTAIFGKPTNRRESSRDDDYDVDQTTQAVTKAETKKTCKLFHNIYNCYGNNP
jgi:hypothetical protein